MIRKINLRIAIAFALMFAGQAFASGNNQMVFAKQDVTLHMSRDQVDIADSNSYNKVGTMSMHEVVQVFKLNKFLKTRSEHISTVEKLLQNGEQANLNLDDLKSSILSYHADALVLPYDNPELQWSNFSKEVEINGVLHRLDVARLGQSIRIYRQSELLDPVERLKKCIGARFNF